jgi:hypothetical protein
MDKRKKRCCEEHYQREKCFYLSTIGQKHMRVFKHSFSINCLREMNYLVKDEQLPIHYNPGKGA